MSKAKSLFLLISISALWCILGCTDKETSYIFSKIEPEFPVPANAKLENATSTSEVYFVKHLREEDGLPDHYRQQIENGGWKETNQMGAKFTFEKGPKKVNIIVLTEKLGLNKE
ncbi:hypothetical protein LJK88_27540 [Paenibacillus sp. P26]|nr:hypothetical protein LJK88_27540 [Paenibacillus sp. P26]UUZ94887.1 hypothetical protein LJK87_10450 [Paenibacillus sp. P25]